MADSSLTLLAFLCISSVYLLRSSAASAVCPRSDFAFLDGFGSKCPIGIEKLPPLEASGETLERELSCCQQGASYSVLFYASWCPFSGNTRSIFDALSSMFPQIIHLAVEESSAMPSILSRYGVHSFPAIVLANRTTKLRYRGSKDLSSLIDFYKKNTGLDPVSYFAVDQPSSPRNIKSLRPSIASAKDIVSNEPYVAFGLLFICLKTLIHFFPTIFACLKALWVSRALGLNVGIFRESSHLLNRALQLVDVRRLWSKLRLCNESTNFRRGAKNARVWASSLSQLASRHHLQG